MRGRTGRMTGYLVGGLTMLKGLPSGYNRDFHEEKVPALARRVCGPHALPMQELLLKSLKLANSAMEVCAAWASRL